MSTFYVDFTTGNDSDDGLSEAGAWKTIAKVNASSFSAGDSILFKRGEVWREQLTVPSSGSAGNPIIFGAYGSGNLPLFNGANVLSSFSSELIGGGAGDLTGDSNLQGYWYMEEATNGTREDGTANNNDLSTANTVIQSSDHQQGTYSAQFVKASSMVLARDSTSLSAGFIGKSGTTATAMSVGFWVKFSSVTGNDVIMSKGTVGGAPAAAFVFYIIAAKIRFLAMLDGANQIINSDNTVTTGVWYHVVGRLDATSKKLELFINGSLQAESYTATSTTISTNGSPLRVGFAASLNYLDGFIDEAFVFDRALTDVEIAGIHTDRLDGSASVTIYYASGVTIEPKQVFEDEVRLVGAANKSSLTPGTFWYDAPNDRVYIRTTGDDSPAGYTIEASQRDHGFYCNNVEYITATLLHLRNANKDGLQIAKAALVSTKTGFVVDGVVAEYNYLDGIVALTGDSSDPTRVLQDGVITNCIARHNGGAGIAVNAISINWEVTLNTVHDNAALNDDGVGAHIFTAGIGSWGARNDEIAIHNNEVYNTGVAVALGGRGSGIYLDTTGKLGPTHNILCYNNRCYDNFFCGIMIEDATDFIISYNLCYDNVASGIDVLRSDGSGVYNNVCYGNQFGITSRGQGPGADQTQNDCIFKNNIASGNTDASLRCVLGGENDGTNGSGNVYEYNCFGAEANNFIEWGEGNDLDTYDAFETAYGGNSHSVEADPLMTDPGSDDFTLQAGSPCIDAGVDVGLTVDYAGNPLT